jgi:hypothetical protein
LVGWETRADGRRGGFVCSPPPPPPLSFFFCHAFFLFWCPWVFLFWCPWVWCPTSSSFSTFRPPPSIGVCLSHFPSFYPFFLSSSFCAFPFDIFFLNLVPDFFFFHLMPGRTKHSHATFFFVFHLFNPIFIPFLLV